MKATRIQVLMSEEEKAELQARAARDNTSLSALTAAMRPKVRGSSTMGVKKSSVCTSARSSDS